MLNTSHPISADRDCGYLTSFEPSRCEPVQRDKGDGVLNANTIAVPITTNVAQYSCKTDFVPKGCLDDIIFIADLSPFTFETSNVLLLTLNAVNSVNPCPIQCDTPGL